MENISQNMKLLSINTSFEKVLEQSIIESIDMYNKYTSCSSKKVDVIHNYLKTEIEKIIPEDCEVKTEQNVKYLNYTGKKKCDIVISKNDIPLIVIPVKFIMRNYKQNRNNYLENLIGEISGLKNSNPGIKIIPYTIYIRDTPYFKNGNIFSKFEKSLTNEELEFYDIIKDSSGNKTDKCDDYVNILIDAGYLDTDTKKETLVFRSLLKARNIFKIIQEFLKEP